MNFLLQRYISLPIYRSCYDLHDTPSPRFLLRYAHSDVCRQFLLSVPVSIPVSSVLSSLFPPPTIFLHKKGRHHGGFPCVYLYLTTSHRWGFFICGQSSILLARASCRTGTICQPRKFYYLLPGNRFRFSSSSLLLPCPRPADVGCSPPSSSTPYPHNVLRTQILGFGTYTSVQGNSYKSSDCFFLSVTTQNWTPPLSPVLCTGRDIPLLLRFLSPISQRSQTFSYLSSFFSIEFLSAILSGKYDLVLAIPACIH